MAPEEVAGLLHRDAGAEVALLVQGAGEDRHAGQPFGLQLLPDAGGLGVGGRGARASSWMGTWRGDTSATKSPYRASLRRGSGSADPSQGGPLQHRHRLVVAGDGHVEDGLESRTALFPKAL